MDFYILLLDYLILAKVLNIIEPLNGTLIVKSNTRVILHAVCTHI